MTNQKRIQATFSPTVLKMIDDHVERLGMNRSSFLTMLAVEFNQEHLKQQINLHKYIDAQKK